MSAPVSQMEPRAIAWAVLAQYWVDTWYDDDQLEAFASRLRQTGLTLRELDLIARRDVCGAFATFTLGVFVSAGMALPDWYYPEDEAQKKVSTWLARPRLLSWLNPFWLIGYCMALAFLGASWSTLRTKVKRGPQKPAAA